MASAIKLALESNENVAESFMRVTVPPFYSCFVVVSRCSSEGTPNTTVVTLDFRGSMVRPICVSHLEGQVRGQNVHRSTSISPEGWSPNFQLFGESGWAGRIGVTTILTPG